MQTAADWVTGTPEPDPLRAAGADETGISHELGRAQQIQVLLPARTRIDDG